MEAAFFDLDKTIISRSSSLALSRPMYRAGMVSRGQLLRGAYAQLVYLLVGADEKKMERLKDGMLALTKGWERAEVERLVAEGADLLFVWGGDGTVQGIFSNGQTAELARLALATFNNPTGLVKMGSNRYNASISSGEPSIGVAGDGGRGTIAGSTLELSNVDMAAEFISMIVAQRGYQANSRMITTTDEILQDSINLKR